MLLAFEVVLFGGLAFMFFCILRNQDSMLKTMREEHGAIPVSYTHLTLPTIA